MTNVTSAYAVARTQSLLQMRTALSLRLHCAGRSYNRTLSPKNQISSFALDLKVSMVAHKPQEKGQ